MENINKSKILSFEEFVAGDHDSEMDQAPMGGMEPQMGEEMPIGGDEVPSHEPVQAGMELMPTQDANLDLMDEPEAEPVEDESQEDEG
jgi:hypothetical protein